MDFFGFSRYRNNRRIDIFRCNDINGGGRSIMFRASSFFLEINRDVVKFYS